MIALIAFVNRRWHSRPMSDRPAKTAKSQRTKAAILKAAQQRAKTR
jgi:hypothetical protein